MRIHFWRKKERGSEEKSHLQAVSPPVRTWTPDLCVMRSAPPWACTTVCEPDLFDAMSQAQPWAGHVEIALLENCLIVPMLSVSLSFFISCIFCQLWPFCSSGTLWSSSAPADKTLQLLSTERASGVLGVQFCFPFWAKKGVWNSNVCFSYHGKQQILTDVSSACVRMLFLDSGQRIWKQIGKLTTKLVVICVPSKRGFCFVLLNSRQTALKWEILFRQPESGSGGNCVRDPRCHWSCWLRLD